MASRKRQSLLLADVLSLYLYGTFLWNYLPGRGDPGLFGFAPNFLLAAIVGALLAAGTDQRVLARNQFVRIGWYPLCGILVSLPLFGLLLLRGEPIVPWLWYPVAIDTVLGIGQEIRRW